MLKEMNIFVRSHLSALENDQVSAVRVRWEREKRKHAEEAAAQEGPPQGGEGRGARAGAGRGRGRAGKRRRTAAEVAAGRGAAQQAERAAELARARARASDRARAGAAAGRSRSKSGPARCSRSCRPTAAPRRRTKPGTGRPPSRRAAGADAPRPPLRPARPFIPPRIQRSGSGRGGPGRKPAASARAGPSRSFSSSGPSGARRGRRGAGVAAPPARASSARTPKRAAAARRARRASARMVDQEAVQANILQDAAGHEGQPGRKGVRRSDEPSLPRVQVAGRLAEEKETREDPHPGQRVHLRLRAGRRHEDARRPRSSSSRSRSWA